MSAELPKNVQAHSLSLVQILKEYNYNDSNVREAADTLCDVLSADDPYLLPTNDIFKKFANGPNRYKLDSGKDVLFLHCKDKMDSKSTEDTLQTLLRQGGGEVISHGIFYEDGTLRFHSETYTSILKHDQIDELIIYSVTIGSHDRHIGDVKKQLLDKANPLETLNQMLFDSTDRIDEWILYDSAANKILERRDNSEYKALTKMRDKLSSF